MPELLKHILVLFPNANKKQSYCSYTFVQPHRTYCAVKAFVESHDNDGRRGVSIGCPDTDCNLFSTVQKAEAEAKASTLPTLSPYCAASPCRHASAETDCCRRLAIPALRRWPLGSQLAVQVLGVRFFCSCSLLPPLSAGLSVLRTVLHDVRPFPQAR